MSCVAFAEEISSKFIYIHVDNVAAQSALINAGSVNHSSRSLVYLYLDFEQRLKFVPWVSRVASASNIADGPSRSSVAEVEGLGAECFIFPKEVFRFIIQEFIKKSELIWQSSSDDGMIMLTDQMIFRDTLSFCDMYSFIKSNVLFSCPINTLECFHSILRKLSIRSNLISTNVEHTHRG